jgi:hypothetical protein
MQLPPPQVTRAVVQRYARIIERYDAELGTRPMVLPNGSYFPDRFERNEASLQKLVARMQAHAGMGDIPITPLVVPRGAEQAALSSCSSGACGVPSTAGSGVPRLVEQEGSWTLQIPEAELAHPIALTTNIARSLAFVFLVETQEDGEILEPPVDVTADLVAVALGFGVLMLQGSYIYAKSCGGPSIASVTKVSIGELAIAHALFAARGGHSIRTAMRELETTQRAVLDDAHALVQSNRTLVARLESDAHGIATGKFELEESKSWLSRLMGKPKPKTVDIDAAKDIDASMSLEDLEAILIDMPPASSAGRVRPPKDPSHDELKALVSEALQGS